MKVLIKFLLVILITLQFYCKSGNQNEKDKSATGSVPAAAANKSKEKLFANVRFASKRDTSCGMPLSAGLEDTVQLNDKIYGFCSEECKNEFINILKIQKKR